MVETRCPFLSITRIDPAEALPQVPSGDGKLPTRTKPFCRTFSAVVNPSGIVPWKNSVTGAFAGTSTIVVPLPWRFVLVLKFETRTSPGLIVPPAGNTGGTKATPYGFKSPLAGTVDTTRTGPGRNGLSSAFNTAGQNTQSRTAVVIGINRRLNFISLARNCETVIGFLRTKSRFMESPFCVTAARGMRLADRF